jgi:hypothetical protein
VEWKSGGGLKADDSLKSFVFTLKNPHNIPARKFVLNAEKKDLAIVCASKWGPIFGFGDIFVSDNCNANSDSCTFFGLSDINDIGLDGETVFAGSLRFKVKEIEVLEITD